MEILTLFFSPLRITQSFLVPHTLSPFSPLLERYIPVTPLLSVALTVVGFPLSSVKISDSSEGISNALSTLIANIPSLLSPIVTGPLAAVKVEI